MGTKGHWMGRAAGRAVVCLILMWTIQPVFAQISGVEEVSYDNASPAEDAHSIYMPTGPAPEEGYELYEAAALPTAPDPANVILDCDDSWGIPPGCVIVEGDIVVPEEFFETVGARGCFAPSLWPDGVVPFEFDENVSADNQAAMLGAMATWEAVASVEFRPRTDDADYLHIVDSPGNWSFVGMINGRQDIGIHNWGREFTIAHELAHALGIWHEQSRTDRDTFVTVDWDNICQDCCDGGSCDHNFAIVATSTAHGPYDYDSIMHYGECAFSTCGGCPNDERCTNGGRTIVAGSPIGQRDHLSDGDINVMRLLYPQGPIARGITYLRQWQGADGSWLSDPAVTSFAVLSMLNAGYGEDDPDVAEGLAYVLSRINGDGSVHNQSHRYTYYTSIAILPLVATHNPDYHDEIAAMRTWLVGSQWDESCFYGSVGPSHSYYGGFGYGNSTRPDLSNTQWALMGLKAGDNELELQATDTYFKALTFLDRCRRADGGSYYTPSGGGSIHTMTAASVWSYTLCNIPSGDPRVLGGIQWLTDNYSLTNNDGWGYWSEYYYKVTFAKAMVMTHKVQLGVHDWFAELSALLATEQQDDGSWPDTGMMGAEMSTCWAIMALQTRTLPPGADLSMSLILASHADVHIYDGQGRHVGVDYATNTLESEIPGGTFRLLDAGDNEVPFAYPLPDDIRQAIHLPQLAAGSYRVELVGTSAGAFELTASGLQDGDVVTSHNWAGDVVPGDHLGMHVTVTAMEGGLTLLYEDLLGLPVLMVTPEQVEALVVPDTVVELPFAVHELGNDDMLHLVSMYATDLVGADDTIPGASVSFDVNDFDVAVGGEQAVIASVAIPTAPAAQYEGSIIVESLDGGTRSIAVVLFECAADADCADGIECTSDICNEVTHKCEHYPHHELCQDGVYCDGVELCDAEAGCVEGEAVDCDDGIACTIDGCDEATESCYHVPDDAACDDGFFCNGEELCDPAVGCVAGTLPCDDGIDCTKDCDEDFDTCMSDPENCGNLDLVLHAEDGCFQSEQDVCVTVEVSNLDGQAMIGGQFFLKYDSCLLEFKGMAPGDHPDPGAGSGVGPCEGDGESPFSHEIYQTVTENDCVGKIAYAVGLPLGGTPSAEDHTMATIYFRTIVPYPLDPALRGQGDGVIEFDETSVPATQLSDYLGTPDYPELGDHIAITVDDKPPVFDCPDIGAVPNDPGECSAVVGLLPCTVEDAKTAESDGCGLCEIYPPIRADDLSLDAPYPVKPADDLPAWCTDACGPNATCIEWKAVDCAGNEAVHIQCVIVVDTETPSVACPEDVPTTNDPGACGAVVDPGMATCVDNCGECTVTCARVDGLDCWSDAYPVGLTTLTWTATDPSGNSASCEQTVTVTDDEPPVPDCPDDVTQTADPDECFATIDPGTPTCRDNCDECSVTCVRDDGEDLHDPYPVGVTTITCTATDLSGNSASCSYTVTVTDDEPPVPHCPDDITQTADPGECSAVVDPGAATCTDNCECSVICVRDDGKDLHDPYPVGVTTIRCTATDRSGNSASCSYTVTVTDDEAPTIACPPDVTRSADPGECSAVVDPGTATCADNCECEVICVRDDGEDLDDPYPVGVTTIRCTATDPSENSASCSYTVTVTDDEPPVPHCPEDVTHTADPGECFARVDAGMATCEDNCNECTVSCVRSDGGYCGEGPDDPYDVGVTTLTWTATDPSGNSASCEQTVTVTDDENPKIVCPPDVTQTADPGECSAKVDPGMATCEDNCKCTVSCVRSDGGQCGEGSDDPYRVGVTTLTWTATDPSGNSASCEQTVTVTDDEPPRIICPPDVDHTADPGECYATVDAAMATCEDNCECTVTCVRDDGGKCGEGPDDPYPVGVTTLTWTATDPSGNSASCEQTVTITDDEPPRITCPPDVDHTADPGECYATVDAGMATCEDNCGECWLTCMRDDGGYCGEGPDDPYPVGVTTLTWTATDPAGNSASCEQTVTITDDEPPTITCPPDVEHTANPGECYATVDAGMATCEDNCKCTVTCVRSDGGYCGEDPDDPYPVGVTTLTWTATDPSGNSASCEQTVTITDDEPPRITCSPDVDHTADPGECFATVDASMATCEDNCECTVTCVRSDGGYCGEDPDDPYPVGVTTLTWTATDPAGNSAGCEQTVTITDDEPPVPMCPPDVTQRADPGECFATVDPGMATCTDNCGVCTVSCTRDDGEDCWSDSYPVGTTTLTWCAKDDANPPNEACCSQTVEVTDDELYTLDLTIRSEATNLSGECEPRRCISFVLRSCDPCEGAGVEFTFEEQLDFVNGLADFTIHNVPYGSWRFINAKDELHTLASTVSLAVVDGQFTAEIVRNDRLLCGDVNNDNVVDINDYAILFTQYMNWWGPVAGACSGADLSPPWSGPYDANFDCDDQVTTSDFLCILFNFLKFGDNVDECCPALAYTVDGVDGVSGSTKPALVHDGEVTISSVRQPRVTRKGRASATVEEVAENIGMAAAVAADLDGNGVLDVADMALFSQGRNIELPDRFQDIMLEQAVLIENVTPAKRIKPVRPRQ